MIRKTFSWDFSEIREDLSEYLYTPFIISHEQKKNVFRTENDCENKFRIFSQLERRIQNRKMILIFKNSI